MKVKNKLIIFLVGPTAVGKSEVAVELAKKIDGEIISCDSMQVYKDMDIITQVPATKLTKQIPHHLIKILSPAKDFSVADFRRLATRKINQIHRNKKIPIIVGGSGLYVKGLVDGLFPSPAADEKLRNTLLREEQKKGKGFLYGKLKTIDPIAATKLHPNDLRRIIRALEIYKKTKTPISLLKKQTRGLLDKGYDVRLFGLIMPRNKLYKKTDKRVEGMFKEGLLEQVRNLSKYRLSKTAYYALGVKEIKDYLDGKYSKEVANYLLKRNTRHLVKKQLTWFRQDKRIVWININSQIRAKEFASKITKLLKKDKYRCLMN